MSSISAVTVAFGGGVVAGDRAPRGARVAGWAAFFAQAGRPHRVQRFDDLRAR